MASLFGLIHKNYRIARDLAKELPVISVTLDQPECYSEVLEVGIQAYFNHSSQNLYGVRLMVRDAGQKGSFASQEIKRFVDYVGPLMTLDIHGVSSSKTEEFRLEASDILGLVSFSFRCSGQGDASGSEDGLGSGIYPSLLSALYLPRTLISKERIRFFGDIIGDGIPEAYGLLKDNGFIPTLHLRGKDSRSFTLFGYSHLNDNVFYLEDGVEYHRSEKDEMPPGPVDRLEEMLSSYRQTDFDGIPFELRSYDVETPRREFPSIASALRNSEKVTGKLNDLLTWAIGLKKVETRYMDSPGLPSEIDR